MIRKSAGFTCFICEGDGQHSLGVFNGKHIDAYRTTVCADCYRANETGWAPHHVPKIMAHLQNEGLPVPARKPGGWLPLDPN